ncbi:hypothetical protein HaLaN_17785 [Haematococcus lacustris]|uniref:Uncharacterized protein n=1 Tax=Haematococcus lacustris TaxID=44745 RepID=A0A699ZPH4_HAELA|nr:hypothetical protein HaLaN_17785 [Haematococcus lacustris]
MVQAVEKDEHMKKRNDLKEHKRLEEIRKKKSETKNEYLGRSMQPPQCEGAGYPNLG